MKTKILFIALVLACLGLSSTFATESSAEGWKSIDLKNDFIALQIVPEIGGRVIQYKLGNYDFFWMNEQLVDKKPPSTGIGPNGEWLNYGGDKLWPAPQGWDGDQQWSGPPDAVLDGSPYAAVIENEKAIKLTSQEDKRSGIQFSRVIKIFDDTTRVSIDATMKNIDTKNRRWGIWSHTQFNAGNRHGEGYNKNYRAYCPINPDSIFARGYGVIFGLAQNPQFKPDYKNNMMQVHYQRRVGKIGLDSNAGWIATVDATDGFVFVQRFQFEPGKEYPDNSSVEFWMNGLGEIFAYNKLIKMPEDPKDNPYNFESEMIAPFALLKPGESTSFHYDWYAAKIGSNLPVINCSDIAVTCKPLTAKLQNDQLILDCHFGIFHKAALELVLLDDKDKQIEKSPRIAVSPLKPVTVLQMQELTNEIGVPENAVKIAFYAFDAKGKLLGELARAEIIRK